MTELPPQLMNAAEEYATACCAFVTGVRMNTMMPKKAELEKAIAQYGKACAAAEREACAQIADLSAKANESTTARLLYPIQMIAAAIRARKP